MSGPQRRQRWSVINIRFKTRYVVETVLAFNGLKFANEYQTASKELALKHALNMAIEFDIETVFVDEIRHECVGGELVKDKNR